MPTQNEVIFDFTIQGALALRRATNGELRDLLDQLELADRELVALLRVRVPPLLARGRPVPKADLAVLLREVRELRYRVHEVLRSRVVAVTQHVAEEEASSEWAMLTGLVTGALTLPPPARVRGAALARTFEGATPEAWLRDAFSRDVTDLERSLTRDLREGVDPETAVRTVAGTRVMAYRDGLLARLRRTLSTLLHSILASASQVGRGVVWSANRSVVWGLQWVSILDHRTSAVCRSRAGRVALLGGDASRLPPGARLLDPPWARPPAHMNCRSRMVALVGDDVPDVPDVDAWLRGQSPELQDATLGKGKADLFRRGLASVDDFVDAGGRERTLDEMVRRLR